MLQSSGCIKKCLHFSDLEGAQQIYSHRVPQ